MVFAWIVAGEVGGGYIGDCPFIDSDDLNNLVTGRNCTGNRWLTLRL